jgi:hypothetical protein
MMTTRQAVSSLTAFCTFAFLTTTGVGDRPVSTPQRFFQVFSLTYSFHRFVLAGLSVSLFVRRDSISSLPFHGLHPQASKRSPVCPDLLPHVARNVLIRIHAAFGKGSPPTVLCRAFAPAKVGLCRKKEYCFCG